MKIFYKGYFTLHSGDFASISSIWERVLPVLWKIVASVICKIDGNIDIAIGSSHF